MIIRVLLGPAGMGKFVLGNIQNLTGQPKKNYTGTNNWPLSLHLQPDGATMYLNSWLLGQTASWWDRFSGDGILIMGGTAVIMVSAFVVTLIYKIYRHSSEMKLKRDMLDRGMSVDEIERVVAAKPGKRK